MELEHRFEVPVGIDRAWESLLDMEQVAACFPGATLKSSDGEEYTGSVKVKLGPIQLTYQGSARITDTDAAAHRATIEASGKAARSGSTASMTVVAAASEVAPDRTAVVMTTDLTITGRPAQFGRGVMADVGDKILGKFADCLAGKLAGPGDSATGSDDATDNGTATGNAEAADNGEAAGNTESVGNGEAAGHGEEPRAAESTPATPATAPATAAAAPAGPAPAEAPTHSSTYTRSPEPTDSAEPIDLLESAGVPVLTRLAPVVGGLVIVLLIWMLARRRRR